MKKLFTLGILMCGLIAIGQTDKKEKSEATASTTSQNIKHWAIDFGAGVHKPTRPFVSGFTDTPSLWQADLGVRYMINRSFGLGVEVGYNNIVNSDDSVTEFETQYYRVGLEGIVNLGNFVGLRGDSARFGILGHGGAGVGFLAANNNTIGTDQTEHHLNFTVGITPQFRITENLAVFTDLSLIGTTRNHYGWDGARIPGEDIRGFEGLLINASVGLTLYLGDGDMPADFAGDTVTSQIADIAAKVDKLAGENADDDQDGVPNYLDRDNTTESGVRVDNKGRALDKNNNGIPDDMEPALNNFYASKGDVADAVKAQGNNTNSSIVSKSDFVRRLINEGYVNVYFQFNTIKPTTYSLDAVNTLVTYMQDNPSTTATLTGFADELGNPSYNKTLSERRAKMVYDVLIASGISANRLSHNGDGEDNSVDKNSEEARQLVRRVTFRVN